MPDFYSSHQLQEALQILPPLQSIDCVSIAPDLRSAIGIRQVSANEPIFLGHFPRHPILPGVMQIAAMLQVSTILFKNIVPNDNDIHLQSLNRIKFKKPVFPGSTLLVKATVSGDFANECQEFKVQVYNGNEMASSGTLVLSQGAFSPIQHESLFQIPQPDSSPLANEEFFSSQKLQELLPQCPPFLMIDGAWKLGQQGQPTGYKAISSADFLMQGSRTGQFPSFLQLEAAAQLGCAHLLSLPENRDRLGIFISIDSAVFHHPVFAGSRLDIQTECQVGDHFGIASAKMSVNHQLVSETEYKFLISDISL